MAEPAIVVVGAGPAGIRATVALARAGVRVTLIDEGDRPGGQIYRQPLPGAERPKKDLYGFEWRKADAIHTALAPVRERVDYRARTLVWNCFQNTLDLLGPNGPTQLTFSRLIIATGAVERMIPLPGWTLPGVYGMGAAQIALKSQGCAIGQRVVFAGTGPLLPLVAYQYAKAGANVAAVLDTAPLSAKLAALPKMLASAGTFAKGVYYLAALRARRIPMVSGVSGFRIEGQGQVEAIVYAKNGREQRIACDAVGMGFGLRSETQLAELAGCRFEYDILNRQHLPIRDRAGRSSNVQVFLAGDGAGIAGADAAEMSGERAALGVLADLGLPVDAARAAELERHLARIARFRRGVETAFPFPAHLHADARDDLIVCRCEGVTLGDLRQAVGVRGARELNRMKAFSRLGMGRCQGRVCASAGAEYLAALMAAELPSVGRLRAQPPVKPIPVSFGA
jgi:NADPH-dependent 2,4-dienoyl-CoA reductase/sulfur reductase-like enzyme